MDIFYTSGCDVDRVLERMKTFKYTSTIVLLHGVRLLQSKTRRLTIFIGTKKKVGAVLRHCYRVFEAKDLLADK